MTRKDYIKIAAALQETRQQNGGLVSLEKKLVRIFEDDNPKFDAERFLAAANYRIK